jgi:hypothetical protein
MLCYENVLAALLSLPFEFTLQRGKHMLVQIISWININFTRIPAF